VLILTKYCDPTNTNKHNYRYIILVTMRASFLSVAYLFLTLALVTVVKATDVEGLAFLAANRLDPTVTELPSGLQYKIVRKGTGKYHPTKSSPCSCHYTGFLVDNSTKFDSSVDRGEPSTFAPNQVIRGWTEAMQRMVEGDKWELYIPSELAYGERGSPPKIPANAMLIFQLELLEIQSDDKVPALLCNVLTKEECNERELVYMSKIASWDSVKMSKEASRLESLLLEKYIKPELRDWMRARLHIVKQKVKIAASDAGNAEKGEL
jgi:FKBP-type peptidyl-prolyl cis-trans isomerase FklB